MVLLRGNSNIVSSFSFNKCILMNPTFFSDKKVGKKPPGHFRLCPGPRNALL